MLTRLFRPQVIIPGATLGSAGAIGFFGGSLGILSWDTVVFMLVAVVVLVLVGLLVWWLVRRQQAQGLSEELVRRQERNVATASPDRRANLQPITEEFRRNIEYLRKLKKKNGIPAIYYLPWYMIIGAPAFGKSVLLKGSGFRFCVNDTPLKEGGTLHCDWWFTNQGIFLDTAGRLTVHEGGAADRTEWEALLKLLRRFRRKRPIDGVIVAVSANFLLEKSGREVQAYARTVRERIDRSTEFLRQRVPVFVVVTKCDLVEGFKPFFDALPESALSQIVGWTNETMTYEGEEQVDEAFRVLADRFRALRPALMETSNSREQRRGMFPFPEEFDSLQDPLVAFTDGLCREDMYTRSPALAGIYFTSGTQEGTTVSRYFQRVGQQLGLPPEALGTTFGENEPRRPYFVRDLFWKVIAPSVGLAVPVESEKDARRRMILGVASASAAVLLGILTTVSFVRNARYVAAFPARLSEKLDQTTEIAADRPGPSLRENLTAFGEAADVVGELYRHPILDNWGLNKRGRLRADAGMLFHEQFEKKFWSNFGPVLTSGLEDAKGITLSCEERTNLLLGYLGLTGAPAGEKPPLQAAKRLLDLILENSEPADQDNLAKAWAIFGGANAPGREEIDLSSPARVVAEVCADEANPVQAVAKIQTDCWPTASEGCYPRLAAVAKVTQEVLDSRRKSFEELARQLKTRKVDDETRERVRAVLEELKRAGGKAGGGGLLGRLGGGLAQAATNDGAGCVTAYFKTIAPDLRDLTARAEQYHKNLATQAQLGASGQRAVVDTAAQAAFKEIEQAMRTKVELLNAACEGIDLKSAALVDIVRGYALGTVAPRGRVGGASYTRAEWEATCQRLQTSKRTLALGEARPDVQARGLAALDVEARNYSDGFERFWRREIGKTDPGSAGEGLKGAADAFKDSLAKANAQIQGLQCQTVENLERAPKKLADLLTGLGSGLDAYAAAAQKASDWIDAEVKAGKRAEVVDTTMRGEGPVADLCKFIDGLHEPDLVPELRAPVIRQWNGVVLGGLAANQRTAWQQKIVGVSELTKRFPFSAVGETGAPLAVTSEWLDPKAGKLVQLSYQLVPVAAGAQGGPPCDLRVKGNVGPLTATLLRRARSIADVVYAEVEGGKPLQHLTLTFHQVGFAEPDAETKYGVRITQVLLALGGERLTYIMDQPSPKTLPVPLPAAAPVNSFVEVTVAGMGRKADVRPARLEKGGEWSPLALLRQAARDPIPGSDGVRLTWRVPYGSGAPYLMVSFDGDARVKRLVDTEFELEPTDAPDK